jgi:hypothetical protein
MVTVELTFSNEEARALRSRLSNLEEALIEQMAGKQLDLDDYATPAYVALLRIKGALTEHLQSLAAKEQDKK